MNICDLLPKRFENPTVLRIGTTRYNIPATDGVYAFVQNDEVLYVGYTSDLRNRICGHDILRDYAVYHGDVYFWSHKHPAEEATLMVCLKPKLNKQLSRAQRGFEGKEFWDEVVTLMKQHSN